MAKSTHRKSNPTIFIIFGGNGDLTHRKIIPALYNLYLDGQLPENFAIIGTSKTTFTDEKYHRFKKNYLSKF